jgi:hypothetical protein
MVRMRTSIGQQRDRRPKHDRDTTALGIRSGIHHGWEEDDGMAAPNKKMRAAMGDGASIGREGAAAMASWSRDARGIGSRGAPWESGSREMGGRAPWGEVERAQGEADQLRR